MQTALMKALLWDVNHYGSAIVHRKKLAFLAGRSNITPSVWEEIVSLWSEIAPKQSSLGYLEWGDTFTIVAGDVKKL